MVTKDIQNCAETMIAKWLEYTNLWADSDRATVWSDIPADQPIFSRSYVTEYKAQSMMNLEQLIVHLHVFLDDELNSIQLLAVFDVEDAPPELRYVSAEVDTMWRDFWAVNGPSGGFLNTPA